MARIETVLIVHQPPKILLGLKNSNKKFGGKWNGFGGGLKGGESLESCVIRETLDETGIKVKDISKRGKILFKFEKDDEPDHEVYFYKAGDFQGNLNTSKDFIGYRWFHTKELEGIYDQMMPADRYWLPLFIQGKMFKGNVCFNDEFQVFSYEITEVSSLD